MIAIPRLYPIIDGGCFGETSELVAFAEELAAAGCTLLQYRNKRGNGRQTLEQARALRKALGKSVRLIMNDRADLCLAAEFDGVHVGQDDLSPASVRRMIGEQLWIGISTHNPLQVSEATRKPANYLAVGPIFATLSKANPDPVIGIEGVAQAKLLTDKPLVAIGGITRENCRSIIEAGADSVAVISDLLTAPRKSAEDFFRILR
jgi:thiamine-phosphate pyrophosphorylase